MQDSRTMRPRRHSRRSARRRVLAVVAAISGMAVIFALGDWSGLLGEPAAVKSPPGIGDPLRTVDAPSTPRRASYNYSVIPGGVFNEQELTSAIGRDTVVAEHYRGVDPSTMHPENLTADRLAYVSFRQAGRVYWTAHKVRIRSGETILSNGETEIRARCGNGISMTPQGPTSPNEPDPRQLDALTATGPPMPEVLTATGRPMLEALTATGHPMLGALADTGHPMVDAMTDIGHPMLYGLTATGHPMLYGLTDTGHPILEALADTGYPILDALTDSELVAVAWPVALFSPLAAFEPVVVETTMPPLGVPLFAAAEPLAAFAPTGPPINPTPVPEPGTLLLLGSGVACLIGRRWRAMRT